MWKHGTIVLINANTPEVRPTLRRVLTTRKVKFQMATSNHTSSIQQSPLLILCAKCNCWKSKSDFTTTKTGKLYKNCKSCTSLMGRQSRQKWLRLPKAKTTDNRNSKYQQQTGLIYFVIASELNKIKIGFSQGSLKTRLGAMQSQSPAILKILGSIKGTRFEEAEFHRKFSQYHSHLEWFNVSDEIMDFIKNECTKWE